MADKLRDLPQYEILRANPTMHVAFNREREQFKSKHLKAGMKEADAAQMALQLALKKFFPETGGKIQPKATAPAFGGTPEPVPGEMPAELLGKECKMREAVEWVFNNLGKPLAKAMADAPSPGAYTLLEWASEGQGKAEFYKTFASKLLPTRSQLEIEENFSDKGENIATDSLRRIFGKDAVLRLVAEDAPGESGVAG